MKYSYHSRTEVFGTILKSFIIYSEAKFSSELEDALKEKLNLTQLADLENSMVKPFSNPDPTRTWREGTKKSSFNYLLLDPRITRNLPVQAKVVGKYMHVIAEVLA